MKKTIFEQLTGRETALALVGLGYVGLILFGILLCSLSTRIKDIHLNFDREDTR